MSAHRQAAAAQALLLLRLGAELAITRLYALLFHGKWTIDLHGEEEEEQEQEEDAAVSCGCCN